MCGPIQLLLVLPRLNHGVSKYKKSTQAVDRSRGAISTSTAILNVRRRGRRLVSIGSGSHSHFSISSIVNPNNKGESLYFYIYITARGPTGTKRGGKKNKKHESRDLPIVWYKGGVGPPPPRALHFPLHSPSRALFAHAQRTGPRTVQYFC
jgi:hypothetical protein